MVFGKDDCCKVSVYVIVLRCCFMIRFVRCLDKMLVVRC
jgi:hypothetical protein